MIKNEYSKILTIMQKYSYRQVDEMNDNYFIFTNDEYVLAITIDDTLFFATLSDEYTETEIAEIGVSGYKKFQHELETFLKIFELKLEEYNIRLEPKNEI